MSDYTIFVDVEDLFQYGEANPRPSGIQRLVFEILKVLSACAAERASRPRIVFVREGGAEAPLVEVGFEAIRSLFEGLTGDADDAAVAVQAPVRLRRRQSVRGRIATVRRLVVRSLEMLPPAIGEPFLQAGVFQVRALRLTAGAVRARRRRVVPQAGVAEAAPREAVSGRVVERAEGDVFLILGAPWARESFGRRLRRVRVDMGIRPVLLVYDLIPVRRPEWCHQSLVADFTRWLEETLPHCADLMAISDATAGDVNRFVAAKGLKLQQPIRTIPLGTGFGIAAQAGFDAGVRPLGLPKPGSYVLFVSTIEARKNHALLFRVWSRLLRDKPRDEVPTLVFAGRVGWLVADLMQQLDNTDYLSGAIRLMADPSDSELRALYEGCRFTVFPSLFEGWGLPVSESLVLGRPCVASHSTSVPEAGGVLTRYFDPENEDDAYRVIRDVIEDEAGLEIWRERVRAEFVPVPWMATAEAVLETCDRAVSGEGSASR